MRLTKSTITLLVSIIVFSMLLANVANLLSTDQKYEPKNYSEAVPMTDKNTQLIWFIQVSDIHISVFRDPSRTSEFKELCEYILKVYKPPVVLASGDLTDAVAPDNIGSQQIHQEWIKYRDILTNLNVTKQTTWLDIRGNHDSFNVLNFYSKENYFHNYSVQGKEHQRSYFYQIEKDNEIYSFIAIDASLKPGPRRPFNFVGLLDLDELSVIKSIVHKVETSGSKYTIWIGHFPTSYILSHESGGFESLIGKHDQGLAYLCGHLHTIGGLIPKMYTLQQDRFLELELGDWKNNRIYRLLAIDHGLLSFIDVKHNEWPVVLITNPKHALFVIPYKENLNTMAKSTHIRVLAFSLAPIDYVKTRIDNGAWVVCRHVDGPLYVAPWQPEHYNGDIHKIEVHVSDTEGRSNYHSQPFSLDGTRLSFGVLPKLALMTEASVFFKVMFGIFNILTIVPLLVFKLIHCLVKDGKIRKPSRRGGILKSWMRKLWILSSVDRIFWPLILYPVYLIVGPWLIGYIVEDHLGAIFAWGIYVDGVLLPGTDTYAYGFLHLFSFQLPLTLILAHAVDDRFQSLHVRTGRTSSCLTKIGLHLPFIVILSIRVLTAFIFLLIFGTLAFLISPIHTWSVLISVILWLLCLRLPAHCTWDAAKIWLYQDVSELTTTPVQRMM